MAAIDLVGVTRDFGRGPHRVRALDDVHLSVQEGETIGILGDNGAGKTTLLRIVSTLLIPSSGTVSVFGQDAVARPAAAREAISVTFGGDRGLYRRLSGRQNLDFFATLRGLRGAAASRAVAAAIERVGLDPAADRRVETYSKGMRQRLHLAAGTLTVPRILLLDEPTVGIDPVEARRVRDLVADLAADGATIVLTSHLLRDIETLAGRVVMLERGRLRHDLAIAEFLRLTGAVGAVVLTTSAPPDAQVLAGLGRVLPSEPADGRWRTRVVVSQWSPKVLGTLAEISDAAWVEDIVIEKTSLDDVYETLATRWTPR